jgi:hypothetical protein
MYVIEAPRRPMTTTPRTATVATMTPLIPTRWIRTQRTREILAIATAKINADLAPQDLAAILAPADAERFLASDWGQHFRHVPGVPGKFSTLLPWPVLNRILEQHRLEPPRLRLTREGRPVPAASYVSYQPNRRKKGPPIPRLNATALTRELRDGATLVLDAVDELHTPITRLAQALERVFRVHVQVNAYAGWRTCHGFDLHWDDHDVFVLQVAGRKHWKIYGTTRKYPLARDVEAAVDPPTEVLWEGLLSDGDLLYIPRGWWHVATPLDEATLHLTVGVNNPTGADFLAWFVDRLRSVEHVRKDIPHLSTVNVQRNFADGIRDVFINEWRPEVVDEYLSDLDAKSRPRPHMALPWTPTPDGLPAGEFRFRWNAVRSGRLSSNGEVTLNANGRRWRFAQAAGPLLELLLSGRELTLAELRTDAVGEATVRAFVRELVANGLVVVCY